MDAQFQVSSDDFDFEVNQALKSGNHMEDSGSMYEMPEKKKAYKGRGKKKEQQPNMKKPIEKKVYVKNNKKQLQNKNTASKREHTTQIKQKNIKNNFAMQFAEVFDEELLQFEKAENQGNQNIIQQNFENKIQVENQFNQIESEKNQFNFIQGPEEEQIQANEVQQNFIPMYLDNKGNYKYLRRALSMENEHQPLFFKRFLNSLQMTQEEYDNIKQSFPQIPSEYLPQLILEQRQINNVFQNKLPQEQQQQQQIIQNQQQQQDQGNQFFQNQQQPQGNQLNFIETEFKHNPNLSEDNLECSICAQTYLDGDKLAILLCIHRFHLTCFTCWLKKSKQCPICHHG
ncbi:unnamed protein product (macronuclear) [Paramecium tetraurelia]|uniref:RING-type domain-containing protein n=1 Tax=Paramecium tetraurelia TaxID=5888 RepID=A0E7A7_PARTE|nr:uncharacterized protein GSPATT00023902001 [Paramecium tetraurelia]CAK91174.1 unnamed protein product [Paramecium tetraurelia]|eukprot:XP_001458571.1 hypothetical protein (macronuclear) [Paramecium tetraurelia strain d4-2]